MHDARGESFSEEISGEAEPYGYNVMNREVNHEKIMAFMETVCEEGGNTESLLLMWMCARSEGRLLASGLGPLDSGQCQVCTFYWR